MVKLYSTNCPQCILIENLMKQKGIEFEKIIDEDVIMDIANEKGIMSAPFAEIDGEYMVAPKIIQWVNNQ